jgi:hypothetical protein
MREGGAQARQVQWRSSGGTRRAAASDRRAAARVEVGAMFRLLLLLCVLVPAVAQTRLLVSAVDVRTSRPIKNLQASEVIVTDDKTNLPVVELKPASGPADVMLLLDTGLAGPMVQPLAYDLIDQLNDPEQMALVGYADSTELIEDFTASKDRLKQAVAKVRYGNQPQVLDALAAAIGDGFEHATYRRVILLLTAGYEGRSGTEERAVVKLARKGGVSIFPIYVMGGKRGLFEELARQTGGATFDLKAMARDATGQPAARIFDVVRNPYMITLRGTAELSERMKIQARRPGKTFLSALPVE